MLFSQCKEASVDSNINSKSEQIETFDQSMEPIGGQLAFGAKASDDLD